MLAKHQHSKAARAVRSGTSQRLTEALAMLTRQDAGSAATITVAELCRVADVSRNSLYRYHAPILKDLRERQRHGPRAVFIKLRRSAQQRRAENLALRKDIAKLVALADHYFTAYRETATLLERRERELAELRSKAPSNVRVVPRPPPPRLIR